MVWEAVIPMAIAAGLDPAKLAVVSYILVRPGTIKRLSAYFIGAFGVSLIIGFVIVFIFNEVAFNQSSPIPPNIEIAIGIFALLVAVLVATGIAARIRDKAQTHRPDEQSRGTHPVEDLQAGGVEKLPGFEKLPHRVQDVLRRESPWVAWLAGVAVGMPTAYYLAAIAAILGSGVGTAGQLGWLLVFNLIAFAIVEIPLVSFTLAPDMTRTRINQLDRWVASHQRLVITIVATFVGVYLILVGASKL